MEEADTNTIFYPESITIGHSKGIFVGNGSDTYLLLLPDEDPGVIRVKNTTSIVFTFVACILLVLFYSCCWFNQFCSGPRPKLPRSINSQNGTRDFSGGNTDSDSSSNPDRQNEVVQRYDIDVESLPSYTVVSGLPTYDDALEQLRDASKTGIILQPPSIIRIFDEENVKKFDSTENNVDNISLKSGCSYAGGGSPNGSNSGTVSSIIELSPEQLSVISQKRLSLQIAFNSSIRRSSRGRIDLCREVNRNNMLLANDIPLIHRSASTNLTVPHNQRLGLRTGSLT